MKKLAVASMAVFLGLTGMSLAQVSGRSGEIAPGSANGQRNGDAPGATQVPGAPPSTAVGSGMSRDVTGTTGTLSDKSRGPAATTGPDRGPDGTPGNGSPAKQDGGQR